MASTCLPGKRTQCDSGHEGVGQPLASGGGESQEVTGASERFPCSPQPWGPLLGGEPSARDPFASSFLHPRHRSDLCDWRRDRVTLGCPLQSSVHVDVRLRPGGHSQGLHWLVSSCLSWHRPLWLSYSQGTFFSFSFFFVLLKYS